MNAAGHLLRVVQMNGWDDACADWTLDLLAGLDVAGAELIQEPQAPTGTYIASWSAMHASGLCNILAIATSRNTSLNITPQGGWTHRSAIDVSVDLRTVRTDPSRDLATAVLRARTALAALASGGGPPPEEPTFPSSDFADAAHAASAVLGRKCCLQAPFFDEPAQLLGARIPEEEARVAPLLALLPPAIVVSNVRMTDDGGGADIRIQAERTSADAEAAPVEAMRAIARLAALGIAV